MGLRGHTLIPLAFTLSPHHSLRESHVGLIDGRVGGPAAHFVLQAQSDATLRLLVASLDLISHYYYSVR